MTSLLKFVQTVNDGSLMLSNSVNWQFAYKAGNSYERFLLGRYFVNRKFEEIKDSGFGSQIATIQPNFI